jgi:exopolysaccharide biosynthesis polyprenyl glycosylphosphotransferase
MCVAGGADVRKDALSWRGYRNAAFDETDILSADGQALDGALVVESKPRLRIASRGHGSRGRGWLLRRALAAADLLGLLVAFAAAEEGFGKWTPGSTLFLLWLPAWILIAVVAGLYDRDGDRVDHTTAEDLPRLFQTLTAVTWLAFIVAWTFGRAQNDTTKLVMFWLFAFISIAGLRAVARVACRRHPLYIQNTLVVGAGSAGRVIAQKLAAHPEYGLRLLGFVDVERGPDTEADDLPIWGDVDELEGIVSRLGVRRVIVAFSDHDLGSLLGMVRALTTRGVQVDILPRFFEVLDPGMDIHAVEGIPMLGLRPPRFGRVSLFLKRTIDLIGSTFLLLVLSPFLALVALAIKLDSRGPVFFRQVRIGGRGEPFVIWKFRTMVADAEERKAEVAHLNKHQRDPRMFKVDGDPRVTRVGRWLRRRRIDELPQLFNVLRAEMSLVGPRPLIPEEHRWVDEWASKRLDLRPGMTGLWQVLGSDTIDFEDMVKLDYRYVTSWSLGRDIRLILRTAPFLVAPGARDS